MQNVAFRLHTEVVRELDPAQLEDHRFLRAAMAAIPGDAAVVASNRTAPHFSNRAELYIVQQGLTGEFAVVHAEDLVGEEAAWFQRDVLEGSYEVVSKRGPLTVYRRVR